MERTGTEIRRHIPKKKNKFSYAKFRKNLKYDVDGRCTNAFTLAIDTENLKTCYDFIKSKPGNMVRGSDKLTLDGININ